MTGVDPFLRQNTGRLNPLQSEAVVFTALAARLVFIPVGYVLILCKARRWFSLTMGRVNTMDHRPGLNPLQSEAVVFTIKAAETLRKQGLQVLILCKARRWFSLFEGTKPVRGFFTSLNPLQSEAVVFTKPPAGLSAGTLKKS